MTDPSPNGVKEEEESKEGGGEVDAAAEAAEDEEILKRAEEERVAKEKKDEEDRIVREEKEAAERALMSETLYIQVSRLSSKEREIFKEQSSSFLVSYSFPLPEPERKHQASRYDLVPTCLVLFRLLLTA